MMRRISWAMIRGVLCVCDLLYLSKDLTTTGGCFEHSVIVEVRN